MKHFQYLQKGKPALKDISVDASRFEGKSRDGIALKRYKQTLAGSEALSHNQNVADRIRNYCLHILIFILTGHAVVTKFKNFYAKNVLATEDGLNILRVIFLAGSNVAPPFKAIAPGLYAQIDTIYVISETVVSALWPYAFTMWLPQ
jgi:hypothetical protein